MLGYPAILGSEQFSESKAQGKLNFEEQIMSKGKYPYTFGLAISIIVATRTLGNSIRIFSSFSWGIFSHITHKSTDGLN